MPVRYIFEKRQGKSYALNSGIRQARGEILLFTDDDVRLDKKWLVSMVAAFTDVECIGVAGKVVAVWNSPKPVWFQESGPQKLMPAIVSFDLGEYPCRLQRPAPGANVAFRAVAFTKYGLFRTDLGPTAGSFVRGEDTEFCRRLFDSGTKLLYHPDAIVYHPVETHRTKKEYFLSWYFDSGRSAIRTNGIPADAVCYLRVPRYLIRQVVTTAARWCCTLDARDRFYHKLDTFFLAGMITEAYRRTYIQE
jgi:GT2 family glycosyltransferase